MPRNEKHRIAQHNWYLRNKERLITKQRTRRQMNRSIVIEMLGGKCVCCGCNDNKALELNHKFGGGSQDRKNGKRNQYQKLATGRLSLDRFELTCRVCNAKHYLEKLLKLKGRWEIKYVPPMEVKQ